MELGHAKQHVKFPIGFVIPKQFLKVGHWLSQNKNVTISSTKWAETKKLNSTHPESLPSATLLGASKQNLWVILKWSPVRRAENTKLSLEQQRTSQSLNHKTSDPLKKNVQPLEETAYTNKQRFWLSHPFEKNMSYTENPPRHKKAVRMTKHVWKHNLDNSWYTPENLHSWLEYPRFQ